MNNKSSTAILILTLEAMSTVAQARSILPDVIQINSDDQYLDIDSDNTDSGVVSDAINILTKKSTLEAIGDSFATLTSALRVDSLALNAAKMFVGGSDSTNMNGCYSNCHSACHGSRGWR
ncbi:MULTISPECIES: hypothetical protein [Cysteiniphilum]|uniref:Uncharacterized protein n=1 Tax=Cysteiniphilum litorale TaxID=2056700 RepID=A0A8J3E8B1_9GAMM|nr:MULTISPECIES: hypothetical protein [Cysteiniphilum]GGF91963.1 hypothetical protein GCM10010995_06390 [Cysteiniphilum litorale]